MGRNRRQHGGVALDVPEIDTAAAAEIVGYETERALIRFEPSPDGDPAIRIIGRGDQGGARLRHWRSMPAPCRARQGRARKQMRACIATVRKRRARTIIWQPAIPRADMRCAPMATADPASARHNAAHRVATDPGSQRSHRLPRRNSIPWRYRWDCLRIRSANGRSAISCRLRSKLDEASDEPRRAGLAEATEAAFGGQRCDSFRLMPVSPADRRVIDPPKTIKRRVGTPSRKNNIVRRSRWGQVQFDEK